MATFVSKAMLHKSSSTKMGKKSEKLGSRF